MSDEAAFLEALRANPADDTTRLVYADWLDERDRPHEAQYLRAVADLASHAGGTPEYTDAAARLYLAAMQTNSDWREHVGGRFDLVLTGFEATNKISTVKLLRELTSCGLAEVIAMCESAPFAVYSWRPLEELLPRLLRFHQYVTYAGPLQASADIRPTFWPGGTGPETVFDVILAEYKPTNSAYGPDQYSWATHGLAALIGGDVRRADEILRHPPQTLATGLKGAEVADFVRRVRMCLNVYRQLSPESIRIVPRPVNG